MATRSARAERFLGLRRHALDLVPSGAYWRTPTPYEQKVDFARAEAEEGRTVHEARVAVAAALIVQMEDVLARIADPRWRVGSGVLRLSTYDFEVAFARLAAAAYVDGALGHHADARRMGRPASKERSVGLSARGTDQLLLTAAREGRKFARTVLDVVQATLDSAVRDGKTLEQATAEIQSRYASLIDLSESPVAQVAAAEVRLADEGVPKVARPRRGRRMKVRNREQYEAWQRQHIPFSKRIRQTLDTYQQQARVPILNANQSKSWLLTEHTRRRAHGAFDEARLDDSVAQMAYSALMDDSTCEVCEERDGTVLSKGDDWWALNTPPMHPRCRCQVVPVLKVEKAKNTKRGDLAAPDDVSPGYGGYDPNRVRTARKLGRMPGA